MVASDVHQLRRLAAARLLPDVLLLPLCKIGEAIGANAKFDEVDGHNDMS